MILNLCCSQNAYNHTCDEKMSAKPTKPMMVKILENYLSENGYSSKEEIVKMIRAIWKSRNKDNVDVNKKFVERVIKMSIDRQVEVGPVFREMLNETEPRFFRETNLPLAMFAEALLIEKYRSRYYYPEGRENYAKHCIPLALCSHISAYADADATAKLEIALNPEYKWTPASDEFQQFYIIKNWKSEYLKRYKIVLDKRPELLGDHMELLLYAAHARIFELVRLLIEHENSTASLISVNDYGNTAFIMAMECGSGYYEFMKEHNIVQKPLTLEMVKYLADEKAIFVKNCADDNALSVIRENDEVDPELKAEIIRYLEPLYTVVKMLPDGGRLEYNTETNTASFTELGPDGLVEITGEVRLKGDNTVQIVRIVPQTNTNVEIETYDPETKVTKRVTQPVRAIEILKTVEI